MKRYTKLYLAFPLLLVTAFLFSSLSANSVSGPIVQLSIEDTIGPATYDYIDRALEAATTRNAELVIIQMDTPGGLDSSMREIIKNIANSTVPIATYVAPTGARAASAGTYILLASHIAAMAPGTNVGAATPVRIGGTSPLSPPKTRKDKPVEDGQAEDEQSGDDQTMDNQSNDDQSSDRSDSIDAMQKKLINDAVAYIRGLAELHGRNQEWAEKAVRQAASLPASEALKLDVIDIVATDIADLLKQINGREVSVRGHSRTIETTGLPLVQIEPDWRNRLLSVITNPNIAYILMLVGIYGLIFELANPGAIIPGTIGAISLLLAMFAFQLLPVNYAGMGLILLGVLLMVAEAFEPSFGVLGIGGVIAFVIGSIILIDTEAPGFGIDISVIITFAVTSVLMFVFVIGMAFKARRRPVVSGLEEMVGGTAVVVDDFEGRGTVTIHSEKWRASSHVPLHKDQRVKVTDIDGLTLTVEPIDASKEEEQS
jgi:membrane-bound serine protease (ClpP class)